MNVRPLRDLLEIAREDLALAVQLPRETVTGVNPMVLGVNGWELRRLYSPNMGSRLVLVLILDGHDKHTKDPTL